MMSHWQDSEDDLKKKSNFQGDRAFIPADFVLVWKVDNSLDSKRQEIR